MDKLQKAIANLTEAQRTAFLLNRIEGKKHREIAEMLNISTGTSKSNLARARVILKEKIENSLYKTAARSV